MTNAYQALRDCTKPTVDQRIAKLVKELVHGKCSWSVWKRATCKYFCGFNIFLSNLNVHHINSSEYYIIESNVIHNAKYFRNVC